MDLSLRAAGEAIRNPVIPAQAGIQRRGKVTVIASRSEAIRSS